MEEINDLKQPKDSSQKLPLDEVTRAHLVQLGFSIQQAELIERSVNLLTGSSRRVDKELLRQVDQTRSKLAEQGLSIVPKTTFTFSDPEKPPRIYYDAHWQLPEGMYTPRGQRGEPNLNIQIVKTDIIIKKIIKLK